MSRSHFLILAFFTNFCPIKSDLKCKRNSFARNFFNVTFSVIFKHCAKLSKPRRNLDFFLYFYSHHLDGVTTPMMVNLVIVLEIKIKWQMNKTFTHDFYYNTVFEIHRKSLILHCERSQLSLYVE